MIAFKTLHPGVDVGYLKDFFSADDPRPAREQIDTAYRHGGGWRPQKGWQYNPKDHTMQYPGDPVFRPVAVAQLRHEVLIFYEHEYLAIVQLDRTFEMARVN